MPPFIDRHRAMIIEAAALLIAVADDSGTSLIDVIAEAERFIVEETKVGDAAKDGPAKEALLPGRVGYTLINGRLTQIYPSRGPIDKPIPGRVIRRDVYAEYEIVEEEPAGYNTDGMIYLETKCVGKCPRKYRVTTNATEYAEIKAALDRGDRSVIRRCYHKSTI